MVSKLAFSLGFKLSMAKGARITLNIRTWSSLVQIVACSVQPRISRVTFAEEGENGLKAGSLLGNDTEIIYPQDGVHVLNCVTI